MRHSNEAEGAEMLKALCTCARALFPKSIATCVGSCHSSASAEAEYPREAEEVAGVCETRRLQYLAGRRVAREALHLLDGPCGPLLQNPDGTVCWPDGWTGSISHTKAWCLASVARTSDCPALGIDLEETGRMNEPIARRVLLPDELDWLATSTKPFLSLAALFFSAKEALYKTVAPLMKRPVGFHDLRLSVEE
ncbi:MAG: 4'-phosphopantetheinyl transferase superfamily protein, partial [Kiritimatiellae bacterium]|nr:4'-phosphopantetheinyl transferase superfamily protein [Kiritimatiellia bacterium]